MENTKTKLKRVVTPGYVPTLLEAENRKGNLEVFYCCSDFIKTIHLKLSQVVSPFITGFKVVISNKKVTLPYYLTTISNAKY